MDCSPRISLLGQPQYAFIWIGLNVLLFWIDFSSVLKGFSLLRTLNVCINATYNMPFAKRMGDKRNIKYQAS